MCYFLLDKQCKEMSCHINYDLIHAKQKQKLFFTLIFCANTSSLLFEKKSNEMFTVCRFFLDFFFHHLQYTLGLPTVLLVIQ